MPLHGWRPRRGLRGGTFANLSNSNIIDQNNFRLAHMTSNTVGKLVSNMKGKIEKYDNDNVIYKITYKGSGTENCNKIYVGTTKSKLKTRLSSHKTDIKLRYNQNKTAVSATNHVPDFDSVDIIQKENNYDKRFMLDLLHIVDIPPDKRLNYKTDIDNCSQSYKHLTKKFRVSRKETSE